MRQTRDLTDPEEDGSSCSPEVNTSPEGRKEGRGGNAARLTCVNPMMSTPGIRTDTDPCQKDKMREDGLEVGLVAPEIETGCGDCIISRGFFFFSPSLSSLDPVLVREEITSARPWWD